MDSAFQLEIWINSNMTNGVSIKQALRMTQNEAKTCRVKRRKYRKTYSTKRDEKKKRAVILMNSSSVRVFCLFILLILLTQKSHFLPFAGKKMWNLKSSDKKFIQFLHSNKLANNIRSFWRVMTTTSKSYIS